MVYKYVRKSTRQSWKQDDMQHAIEEVTGGGMGVVRAAIIFGVPKSTLHRRITGTNKLVHGTCKGMGHMKTVLPPAIEDDLVRHIHLTESMLFGLSVDDIRCLAYQLAEANGINHPFNTVTKKAGWDWLASFRKRHPSVVLRTPEATLGARAQGFSRPSVNKFFDLLEKAVDTHAYPPSRIYNCDETVSLMKPLNTYTDQAIAFSR